jgi:hypothetical protein
MAVEIISPFWGLQNIARSVLYINVSVSGLKTHWRKSSSEGR